MTPQQFKLKLETYIDDEVDPLIRMELFKIIDEAELAGSFSEEHISKINNLINAEIVSTDVQKELLDDLIKSLENAN